MNRRELFSTAEAVTAAIALPEVADAKPKLLQCVVLNRQPVFTESISIEFLTKQKVMTICMSGGTVAEHVDTLMSACANRKTVEFAVLFGTRTYIGDLGPISVQWLNGELRVEFPNELKLASNERAVLAESLENGRACDAFVFPALGS